MKKLEMFYLPTCSHCQLAFRYIEELKEQPEYKDIEIITHNESVEDELANARDYWFVPCFYLDDVKVAEGHMEKDDIEKVFEMALNKE